MNDKNFRQLQYKILQIMYWFKVHTVGISNSNRYVWNFYMASVRFCIDRLQKATFFDCLIATKRELTWEYKRPFDLYVNLFQIGTNCVLLHINCKPPQRTFLSAIWVHNGLKLFLKLHNYLSFFLLIHTLQVKYSNCVQLFCEGRHRKKNMQSLIGQSESDTIFCQF